MAEPYEMFVVIPGGVAARKAVDAVDAALVDEGGELPEDALLMLNDLDEDDDRDFEEAGERERALARISEWPTLGMVVYEMPDGGVLASFKGGEGIVLVILLATPGTLNDLDEETAERYRRIGGRLHEELAAARTVMGWGLSAGGRGWERQLELAQRGERPGDFEILALGS